MFKVNVTCTSKEQFTADDHCVFDSYSKEFDTLEHAVKFLENFEGTQAPTYRDYEDGSSTRTGTVFKTVEKERDYYTGKCTMYVIHRWVEISEVKETLLYHEQWKAA